MLAMHWTFEDQTVIAERGNDRWSVTVCDSVTGKEHMFNWTDQEFAAVSYLMIGSDEASNASECYCIAEALFANVDKIFRLIP